MCPSRGAAIQSAAASSQGAEEAVACDELGGGRKKRVSFALADEDRDRSDGRRDLHCPICDEVMYRPVRTPCSHAFCMACLTAWLNEAPARSCPMCRALLGAPPVPSPFRRRSLRSSVASSDVGALASTATIPARVAAAAVASRASGSSGGYGSPRHSIALANASSSSSGPSGGGDDTFGALGADGRSSIDSLGSVASAATFLAQSPSAVAAGDVDVARVTAFVPDAELERRAMELLGVEAYYERELDLLNPLQGRQLRAKLRRLRKMSDGADALQKGVSFGAIISTAAAWGPSTAAYMGTFMTAQAAIASSGMSLLLGAHSVASVAFWSTALSAEVVGNALLAGTVAGVGTTAFFTGMKLAAWLDGQNRYCLLQSKLVLTDPESKEKRGLSVLNLLEDLIHVKVYKTRRIRHNADRRGSFEALVDFVGASSGVREASSKYRSSWKLEPCGDPIADCAILGKREVTLELPPRKPQVRYLLMITIPGVIFTKDVGACRVKHGQRFIVGEIDASSSSILRRKTEESTELAAASPGTTPQAAVGGSTAGQPRPRTSSRSSGAAAAAAASAAAAAEAATASAASEAEPEPDEVPYEIPTGSRLSFSDMASGLATLFGASGSYDDEVPALPPSRAVAEPPGEAHDGARSFLAGAEMTPEAATGSTVGDAVAVILGGGWTESSPSSDDLAKDSSSESSSDDEHDEDSEEEDEEAGDDAREDAEDGGGEGSEGPGRSPGASEGTEGRAESGARLAEFLMGRPSSGSTMAARMAEDRVWLCRCGAWEEPMDGSPSLTGVGMATVEAAAWRLVARQLSVRRCRPRRIVCSPHSACVMTAGIYARVLELSVVCIEPALKAHGAGSAASATAPSEPASLPWPPAVDAAACAASLAASGAHAVAIDTSYVSVLADAVADSAAPSAEHGLRLLAERAVAGRLDATLLVADEPFLSELARMLAGGGPFEEPPRGSIVELASSSEVPGARGTGGAWNEVGEVIF